MIRTIFAAAALLVAAVPVAAQSQQEALDARQDRALAAGYKALMLCGAIANAEANGATRTPGSVAHWELNGIQSPLDKLVHDLGYSIQRSEQGGVESVTVAWADDMPPRTAAYTERKGCRLAPIGTPSGHEGSPLANPDPAPRHLNTVLPLETQSEASVSLKATALGAFEGRYGADARTTAVHIASPGGVFEQYHADFADNVPQRTWSVAKSIAATLIGAAVQRGEADVSASAGLGLSADDPRRAITIDHLLRMASGRYSDTPGNRTDPLYWGGATVEEVALDWPLVAAPGSTYRYANNDTLAAVAAIRPTFAAHPPAELFARLGMKHTIAETDWQGRYILSSQVWTTARDLARFGQLYLNDGKLPDGTHILPEGWVKYVSTPSGPQPVGTFGYGAGFWLLNSSEGVPPDTFAAIGNRGQYVVIVPSRQVVIVRRGEDPAGSGFDIAAFTRDVLAALPRKQDRGTR
ncbi:MAG: class C beta-lactamase-related serine hydrolase [Sphingomonadales bacterium]|nr:MAG: class C beta-lactamase-related serine hydrolase [Sphingomonadales bacterium]